MEVAILHISSLLFWTVVVACGTGWYLHEKGCLTHDWKDRLFK